jgi:hypothetical protein
MLNKFKAKFDKFVDDWMFKPIPGKPYNPAVDPIVNFGSLLLVGGFVCGAGLTTLIFGIIAFFRWLF